MSLSFSDVVALWKADKRLYVRRSTYAVYVQHCKNHLVPAFGERTAFDEALLQASVNTWLEEGLALKTVKDIMLVLRMVLRYGEKLGAWPHVEYKVRYPSGTQQKKEPATLPGKDLHRLLAYLRKDISYPNLALLLCLQSGLRIGEVCGLQWRDLDVAAGIIHVNKTVQRIYVTDGNEREYFLSVDRPKTPSALRDIPLSGELKALLRPLKKAANPRHFLLTNAEAPWEPRKLRTYFHTLLQRLGIPKIRFHALRHTFATRCIESRCDYKTVSAILGHASISTTLDLYVHPGYADKKKVIDRLARGI